ncbi:MAG: hypothetical protein PHE47_00120 [Oscillospiraceae bacterium]|nr:hypothetical protein [Oscillospiraceae bacterium]
MKPIDHYSYQCGVIDCFNEMLRAGLKRIALSHPASSAGERDVLIPFSREICQKYGTHFYVEDQPLLTDLFPISLNLGKFHLIYWKEEADLAEYLKIKADKERLILQKAYTGESRRQIARRFGLLLSYPATGIDRLILENLEPEQI